MRIAYFVMRYPTPSQTFIEREMLGVAAHGVSVEVHPCWDFRRGAKSPPGLTVVRAGTPWRLLARMAVGTMYELARRPALVGKGLRVLWRCWPRHA